MYVRTLNINLCCWQPLLQVYSDFWTLLAGSLPLWPWSSASPRPLCSSSTWHFLGPISGPSMGQPYRLCLRVIRPPLYSLGTCSL